AEMRVFRWHKPRRNSPEAARHGRAQFTVALPSNIVVDATGWAMAPNHRKGGRKSAELRGTALAWAFSPGSQSAAIVGRRDSGNKTGQKLGPEYQTAHMYILSERLCQAGSRLAMVLSEAYADRAQHRPPDSFIRDRVIAASGDATI